MGMPEISGYLKKNFHPKDYIDKLKERIKELEGYQCPECGWFLDEGCKDCNQWWDDCECKAIDD